MRILAFVCVAVGGGAGLVAATLGETKGPIALIAAAGIGVLVALGGGVRRAFGISLAAILFGYAAVGKGFSYLGSPPLYIGEVVIALAVCVIAFVRPARRGRSTAEIALWALLAFGAVLLVPGIGPYGVDAFRDAVIFGYAIVALAVARAWRPDTAYIVQRTYERLAPIAVILLTSRLVVRQAFPEALQGLTVNGVEFFATKAGDAAVQLSLFLAYMVLFHGRGIVGWTRSAALRPLFATIAVLGLLIAMLNRGGMIAAATGLFVAFAFTRRRSVFLAGGACALLLLVVVSPIVGRNENDEGRAFTVQQVTENVISVVTNDDERLRSTEQWRLRWWRDITQSTFDGNRLLSGDGFGTNLAFLYGISDSPNDSLRSPHNAVMTVLARGGVAFALLWLAAVAMAASQAFATRWKTRRRPGSDRSTIEPLAALILATITATFVNGLFDVYLEGPAGGMWFWAACGAAIGIARVTRPDTLPRDAPIVTTVAGPVAGTLHRAPDGTVLRRFLGIPYAAPPVGDLRWRAPRPPEPWSGTRSADTFAPAAPQGAALESRLPGFRPDHPTDEDCLALNVWTPGLHGARPVLVWFPGGAYLNGGTAQPVYDGSRLAAEANAVVVTVGYRLGALGFLDPEGDGVANCGLRDQLAALDWIRDHATAFGGNPMEVTIMGESAGAGSVLHLLASPRVEAAPTFRRAIVQSGQPTTLTEDDGRAVAEAFARHLGIDRPDADTLRAIPVDRLLEAQAATSAEMLAAVGPMAFAPVIDDDVCDGTIVDAIARGRASDIGLVIGTTRDELALFAAPSDATLDDERLLRRLGHLFGDTRDPERALADYRHRLPATATNADVWNAATTDVMMRAPALRVADAHTTAGGTTFVYRFDWAAPGLGAAHAVDLPFTFGTADREGWDTIVGWDRRAEALGHEWRACWSYFAATGDPSTPVRHWPQHDPADPAVMVFSSDGARVVTGLDASLAPS